MCGIGGVTMAHGSPAPAMLQQMTLALAHRGPDGSGHFVVGRAALVHTRLAIIDLLSGDQPLFAGPATLVGNGEIYNYIELQAGLRAAGVVLATSSDCEPPLHLWRQQGSAYTQQLQGMYAIAIHERAGRSVTLSRDPFGIKPLYTAAIEGGLLFASEAQALLATGLVPAPFARPRGKSCCRCSSRPVRIPSSPAFSACCPARR